MSNRNIQASVQGNSLGKRFLPVIGGGVTGLQSTPPRRGGAKNDGNKLSQKEKNGMIGHYEWSHLPPLPVSSWIEPASLLLTDTEFRSIDSPPLDLGLHFSSIDQWVLSDLDVGLDHLAESDTSGYQALNHPPFTVAAETESCVIEVSGLSSAAETELCISNVGSSSSVPENRKGGKRKHTESPLDGSKLLVDDIMAIFAAVRENYRPPPRLKFQIVLGTKGQKISPPSFEFRDGLFILMKPQKSRRNRMLAKEQTKFPDKLLDFVMTDSLPLNCPWSISGPQYAKPTGIQKRYCYSNGNQAYSSHKGATLWTMYGPDGTEDFEYRLLHVYHSSKRGCLRGTEK